MQHASHSIGAIAAALAKAQAELLNPQNRSCHSLSLHPLEPARTFRYAPLASGLEIVRRASAGMRSRPFRRPRSTRLG